MHLEAARRHREGPLDEAALSIIDETDGRHVRMGHLAFVGSHRVNGVSALHTNLMRETVFADLHRLYPERIVNKTNGITFRRWLHQANPRLTGCCARSAAPRFSTIRSSGAGASRRAGRRSGRHRASRRRQARQQDRAEPLRLRADRRAARPERAVRRAYQAHPRIQAAIAEPARHGGALSGDPRRSGRGLGAAGQDFRRQGRVGLCRGPR